MSVKTFENTDKLLICYILKFVYNCTLKLLLPLSFSFSYNKDSTVPRTLQSLYNTRLHRKHWGAGKTTGWTIGLGVPTKEQWSVQVSPGKVAFILHS